MSQAYDPARKQITEQLAPGWEITLRLFQGVVQQA